MRWSEEVRLIQEEMCRVSAYLSWYVSWWSRRADHPACQNNEPPLSEGLTAYALRQAQLRVSLQNHFQLLWGNVALWVAADEVPEDAQRP